MSLDSLGELTRAINESNGWNPVEQKDWASRYRIPASLALLHSEVSEALEEFRVNNPEAFLVELADVQIRLLDLACGLTDDFEEIVRAKLEKNRGRSHRHGDKRV